MIAPPIRYSWLTVAVGASAALVDDAAADDDGEDLLPVSHESQSNGWWTAYELFFVPNPTPRPTPSPMASIMSNIRIP